MSLRVTMLGSGTSTGVPVIGCTCKVCQSANPKNKRWRPGLKLEAEDRTVLVDTPTDLREQALRFGLSRVDAILFTHAHADHVMGLDDLRPFNFRKKAPIPIFAAPEVMTDIRRCFQYIFDGVKKESNVPQLDPRLIDGSPFDLFGLEFLPVPIMHGRQMIHGFRFGNAAYLTDHSAIPESSMELLQGLDVLFLDALRYKPHPTHSTVDRSVRTVEQLSPNRAFFTHICHDLAHERAESMLPSHIRLAYDGLEIDVEPFA